MLSQALLPRWRLISVSSNGDKYSVHTWPRAGRDWTTFWSPFARALSPSVGCSPWLSPPFHVITLVNESQVWGNTFNHRKSLLLCLFFEAGSGTHLGDQTGLKLAFASWVLLFKMCALLIFQKDNLAAYENLEPTFIHVSTYLAYEKLTSLDLGRAQNSIIQTAEKTTKLDSIPKAPRQHYLVIHIMGYLQLLSLRGMRTSLRDSGRVSGDVEIQ